MNLDQFLKTKGVCGSRTKNALASEIIGGGYTRTPEFTTNHEQLAKNHTENYFLTGRCNIRGLGKNGLLLLAEYFKITVPQKDTNVNSLRQKLAHANARIAKLERGEYICRKCGLRKDSEKVEADF